MPDPFKPFKPKDIQELIDLFDNDEVTTADQVDRPQKALDREMFEDFNKRNPLAGGGMLVQPGFGDMREGFKKDYDVKELDKATKYYTKGEFKKFSDIKGFGQCKDPEFIKKYNEVVSCEEGCLSFPDEIINVNRPDKIVVKYEDEDKKEHKIKLSGMASRVFQHEFDHLEGIDFTQR